MAGAIMDKIWGVIGTNNNPSAAEEPENDDYDVKDMTGMDFFDIE